MTIEDRLKKIGDCDIKIIKSEIVKDAKLVIFKFDEFDTSAAIIYNTGELFHLKDWQGGVPATQKDIEEFDWLSEDGKDAIVLDGLTKTLNINHYKLCYRHDGHKLMNSYNIYEKNNEATILYHAIARDEDQVMELAKEAGIDMDGLSIELERSNVKDQLGKPLSARIEDALIY